MQSLFFVHGGRWNDNKYEGGRKEFIPIPSSGMTFEELLDKLEVRLKKDRKTHLIDIDALVQPSPGESVRMKITDNFEWSCLGDILDVPIIYVTVCNKSNEFHRNSIIPMSSVNIQNELALIDDVGVDSCSVDTLHNSSDRNSAALNSGDTQWVIPGASYQDSIPCDDIVTWPEPMAGELFVGATFKNKDEMTSAVGLYHLRNCLESRTERSDLTRYYVVCKNAKRCQFSLRSKGFGLSWRIQEFIPHTREIDLKTDSHPKVSSKVVAGHVGVNLTEDGFVLRPRDIQSQILRDFGINLKYSSALTARNVAHDATYGDQEKSFQLLPKYFYMLEKLNPGSIVDFQTSDGMFQYCYFSLDACRRAFRACRPVIIIDAAHLKGKYKGVMFVASTKDSNEQIVPLAFGVGDKENDSSWTWFLLHVRQSFGTREQMLIVSDQHISIKNAVESVFPGVPHCLCTYHIQGNLKASDEVIEIFQDAANAYRDDVFSSHMDNLELCAPGAHAKLLNIGPSRWAKSKCPVRRYDFGTSNAVECLNSRLKWARKLPLCSLLEYARNLMQTWFCKRRSIAGDRTFELSEYAMMRLANATRVGRAMKVEGISESKFKIISGIKSYVVDICAMKCSCHVWQMDLFPCSHAARAISYAKQSLYGYVHSYYTTATWREIYAAEIMPVPDPCHWRVSSDVATRVVGTPSNPKQAGRPRAKRIQSRQYPAKDRVCSRCKQKGHYRSTCSAYLEIIVEDEQVSGGKHPRSTKKCGICGVAGHFEECATTHVGLIKTDLCFLVGGNS